MVQSVDIKSISYMRLVSEVTYTATIPSSIILINMVGLASFYYQTSFM